MYVAYHSEYFFWILGPNPRLVLQFDPILVRNFEKKMFKKLSTFFESCKFSKLDVLPMFNDQIIGTENDPEIIFLI